MLTQDGPGSVVTTASQDGLCAAQGVYGVSKHACVALTEALHGEVANRLSVHVLCPNVVATNIVTSERNRPERFGGPVEPGPATAVRDRIAERFRSMGMPPSRCAQMVSRRSAQVSSTSWRKPKKIPATSISKQRRACGRSSRGRGRIARGASSSRASSTSTTSHQGQKRRRRPILKPGRS